MPELTEEPSRNVQKWSISKKNRIAPRVDLEGQIVITSKAVTKVLPGVDSQEAYIFLQGMEIIKELKSV
jgi:hypothetical protein